MDEASSESGYPWYDYEYSIGKIVIEDGVTSIAPVAFNNYGYVTEIEIPESVTSIGDDALPLGIDIIGKKGSYAETFAQSGYYNFYEAFDAVSGSFTDDDNNTVKWNLDADGNLTISGNGAIPDSYSGHWGEYRSRVRCVVIEDGITSIGSYAFYNMGYLSEITIPDSVTYIDYYSFYFCASDFKIKAKTYSAAYFYAQENNYQFESLGEMAESVIAEGSCGENASYKLTNRGVLTVYGTGEMTSSISYSDQSLVTKIVVENGVTSLCRNAFYDFSSVNSVQLPDTLTSIGESVFKCYNLDEIIIPASVTSISSYSFSGNSDIIIKGYTPSAAKDFAEKKGYTFVSLGDAPVSTVAQGSAGEKITWTLDNYGLLKISGTGDMDFSNSGSSGSAGGGVGLMSSYSDVPWYSYRAKIKTVEIANGITSVGDYAFYNCSSLKEIALPESVKKIGEIAFGRNSALEKVTIHYNTDEIASNAFGNTYNATIYGYSNSVAEEYATEKSIKFVSLGEAPVLLKDEGNVTDSITWKYYSDRTLVIEGTGDMPSYEYGEERPWEDYMSSIKKVEIKGVDKVGKYTISYGEKLKQIVIDAKAVENYAFYPCYNLEKITLSERCVAVARYAFGYDASSITISGYANTYAQSVASSLGATFEPLEGDAVVKTVYVSTVEELIGAIASNTTIVVKDGTYLLDKTMLVGNEGYTQDWMDGIRIKNVFNLTIKAEHPGKVEFVSLMEDVSSNFSSYNSVFYITGGYNLVIDGIRMGNMQMRGNNGSAVKPDDVELMGGYDEDGMSNYSGAYCTVESNGAYESVTQVIGLTNKIKFVNCDIFNCSTAVNFVGESLTIENCTIRDNAQCAVSATDTADVVIKNSVFSNNGNNSQHKSAYCLYMNGTIENCTFVNNGNNNFVSGTVTERDNVIANNAWDGETVKAYGITQNGITWSVTAENVLKLGYAINSGEALLESKTGEVYPYTEYSLPWKNYSVKTVDASDGVVYGYKPNAPCGKNIAWTYDEETKTITLTGSGNMSDVDAPDVFDNAENIIIDERITGVYNIFRYSKYAQNEENWENGLLYIGDVLVNCKYGTTGDVIVKNGTRIIAEDVFNYKDGITSIVVPEGVTNIGITEKIRPNQTYYGGNGPFSNMSSLTSLTLPKSLVEIDHAFAQYSTNLSDIYYSGTVKEWENLKKGYSNDQLKYVTIHASDGIIAPPTYEYEETEGGYKITSISPNAKDVVIPKEINGVKVVEIADGIFTYNTTIKSVAIYADVAKMPSFAGCTNLESVEFTADGMYMYGNFTGCEKLASIKLGDNFKEFYGNSFKNTACYKNPENNIGGVIYIDGYAMALSPDAPENVTIPSTARGIASDFICNNSTVKTLVISDGVEMNIAGELCCNMEKLESLTLPDTFVFEENSDSSASSSGDSSGLYIENCDNLKNVYVSANNNYLTSIDGVVFTKDKKTIVYMPMGRTGSYEIPDGAEKIAKRAFSDTKLESLTIPESVNYIADMALYRGYYMTDIYYDITVEQWEDGSVYQGYGNNILNQVTLHLKDYTSVPEKYYYYLNEDGTYTFKGCLANLTTVTIPKTYKGCAVTSIDTYAFLNKPRLEEINVELGHEYFTSVDGVLFTKDMTELIAYPAGKTDVSYTIPDTVKTIRKDAFAYAKNLKSVNLSNVENVEPFAFEYSGITTVTIPETLTNLKAYAFWTDSLETVYMGTTVTSIESGTFGNNLKKIVFDGTREEWQNVTGWYYFSDEKVVTKVKITAEAHVVDDGEVIYVAFDVDGVSMTAQTTAFVLGIDSDGNTVSFDSVHAYHGGVEILEDEDTIKSIKTVKVFVWESFESMKPLGEAVEIEIGK